jgi:uncharacterized protein with FMN-binding domain
MSGTLLALGGAAVVSIYTVGYTSSQSSIDDLTAQLDVSLPTATSAPAATATPSTTTASRQGTTRGAGGTTATVTPTPPTTTSASATYADGTYTGTGTSRHGNITVAVVIQGGKITSAAVSDCQTRYPCSDVNPLVSAVLTNQTVPTNNVSGATDSSRAYKTAVTQALQKALTGA